MSYNQLDYGTTFTFGYPMDSRNTLHLLGFTNVSLVNKFFLKKLLIHIKWINTERLIIGGGYNPYYKNKNSSLKKSENDLINFYGSYQFDWGMCKGEAVFKEIPRINSRKVLWGWEWNAAHLEANIPFFMPILNKPTIGDIGFNIKSSKIYAGFRVEVNNFAQIAFYAASDTQHINRRKLIQKFNIQLRYLS